MNTSIDLTIFQIPGFAAAGCLHKKSTVSGLKTWLNFGVTVAGNPKQQATFEPTPHAETHSHLKKMWSEQSAKLGSQIKLENSIKYT